MAVRVPDNGYCVATSVYEYCTPSITLAKRRARKLANIRHVRVDLVKISNRGEDRDLIGEFFPKRLRYPGGDSR